MLTYRFIDLPHGRVHYELSGAPGGPPVVLIHGLTSPLFVWDPTAAALAEAGFAVVRFDLYGRGASAKPPGVYGPARYDRQLWGLLEALEIRGPVDLVGLSMGGAIAVRAAANRPDRVRRLGLVAPAGFPVGVPKIARLVLLPGVGEVLMRLLGERILRRGARRTFADDASWRRYWPRFAPQLGDAAFRRAILSTLRYMPLEAMQTIYDDVGRHPRPVLLVWGERDQVVPIRVAARVQRALPASDLLRVPGAGHLPHFERPDLVNPALVDFLSR